MIFALIYLAQSSYYTRGNILKLHRKGEIVVLIVCKPPTLKTLAISIPFYFILFYSKK